mgnify:FL=1
MLTKEFIMSIVQGEYMIILFNLMPLTVMAICCWFFIEYVRYENKKEK